MANWMKDIINSNISENSRTKKKSKLLVENNNSLTELENCFLEYLVDSEYSEFQISSEGNISQNIILQKIKEKISKENIFNILVSLEKKGYLEKNVLGSSVQCPDCYSKDIKITFSCPNCNSNKIIKNEIIEHPYCGYRGNKSQFNKNGKLVCPQCLSILTRKEKINKENDKKFVIVNSYLINGSVFKCEECGNIINKPNINFTCNKCETKFNYKNAEYQNPIKYVIPDEKYKNILNRNKVKILIIEDSELEAESLSLLIENIDDYLEYEVTITNNGTNALLKIEKTKYNLVIQDLGLPDINGLTLLQEIKKIDPETLVLVYTGRDDRETAVKAMKLGASEFIVKNNQNIEAFIETLKNNIQKTQILK